MRIHPLSSMIPQNVTDLQARLFDAARLSYNCEVILRKKFSGESTLGPMTTSFLRAEAYVPAKSFPPGDSYIAKRLRSSGRNQMGFYHALFLIFNLISKHFRNFGWTPVTYRNANKLVYMKINLKVANHNKAHVWREIENIGALWGPLPNKPQNPQSTDWGWQNQLLSLSHEGRCVTNIQKQKQPNPREFGRKISSFP